MGVEILTVRLSDESVEAVANAVARRVSQTISVPNGATTECNRPSPEYPQGAERSSFPQQAGPPQQSDPWLNAPAPQQAQPHPQPAVQQALPEQYCPHGKMRFVEAGVSAASGKPYNAFYGCPLPRGDANQCPPRRI